MSTKPISRAWWYRLIVGLLAAFSWCVAVTAFAGRFSGLRSHSGQTDLLALAGWGLGLCAFVLLADLLGSARSTDFRRDV
jgi:hypothetical protein